MGSRWLPRIPTPVGVAGGVATATSGPLNFFVDGTSGNDSNPGTQAAPLRTLVAAEAKVPYLLDSDVQIVVVSAGTYTLPSFRDRVFRSGQLYVWAQPVSTLKPSASALAGTTVSLIKSGGLVVDAYRGAFIHVLTGAAAGDYRTIKKNTATDVIPVRDFSAVPVNGDLYEIVYPVVNLDVSALPVLHGMTEVQGSGSLLYERSLNFENFLFAGTVAEQAAYSSGRVAFWRCATPANEQMLTSSRLSQVLLGIDAVTGALRSLGPQLVHGGSATTHVGAGLTLGHNHEPQGGGFFGYVVATGLFVQNAIYTQIFGGNIHDSHLTASGFGTGLQLGGDGTCLLEVTTGNASGALKAIVGGTCNLGRVTVNGSGTIGVAAESGGSIVFVGSTAFVTGTGATYGCFAKSGGKIYTNAQTVGITGGTANLAVGLTPDTAASIAAVGGSLVPSTSNIDGSVISRYA